MKILCLGPLVPLRVESYQHQGRWADLLITCDPPGDRVEYFFEDNPEKRGKGFAAIRLIYKSNGDATPASVLLAPYRSQADKFGLSGITNEDAQWLRVCLTFAQREYSPWTKQKEIAALRATHWFRSGDFNPKRDKDILWYSAIRWREWRKRKWAWKECVADLEEVLKKPLTDGSADSFDAFCEKLRKACGRAGLERDW